MAQCVKTAEPIELPFEMASVVGSSNRVLDAARIRYGKEKFAGLFVSNG